MMPKSQPPSCAINEMRKVLPRINAPRKLEIRSDDGSSAPCGADGFDDLSVDPSAAGGSGKVVRSRQDVVEGYQAYNLLHGKGYR